MWCMVNFDRFLIYACTLEANSDCLSNLTLGTVTVASRVFYCTWNDLFVPLCEPFLTAMLESLKQGVYVAYIVIHVQDGDEADS